MNLNGRIIQGGIGVEAVFDGSRLQFLFISLPYRKLQGKFGIPHNRSEKIIEFAYLLFITKLGFYVKKKGIEGMLCSFSLVKEIGLNLLRVGKG
jgi:hypothetical protein